jgi:2-methylfumaryl-CoA isomerase
VAEVLETGRDRPRIGNDLYGAFGRDYRTRDGCRLMIVAITTRQWTGLLRALDLEQAVAGVERELGVSLAEDEGLRFEHRHRLHPLIEAAVAARPNDDLVASFTANGVCFEPFRSVREAVAERCEPSDLYTPVSHPSGRTYPTPGTSATLRGRQRLTPPRAPRLGEHTDQVLAEVLGLPDQEIGRLHDCRLVAGP